LMMRAGYYMSFGRSSNNNNGIPIQLLFILVGAVVYGLSFILIRSLSRYRELAADRAAAILTGAPSTLASALTKLSGDMSKIPEKDLRSSASANHLALIPAVSGKAAIGQRFSTHPSLEKRLDQLSKISAQLSRPECPTASSHPRRERSRARPPGRLRSPHHPDRTTSTRSSMGFFDALLGRTKPKRANLDDLFALPPAALTLQAATGFTPTG